MFWLSKFLSCLGEKIKANIIDWKKHIRDIIFPPFFDIHIWSIFPKWSHYKTLKIQQIYAKKSPSRQKKTTWVNFHFSNQISQRVTRSIAVKEKFRWNLIRLMSHNVRMAFVKYCDINYIFNCILNTLLRYDLSR